MAQAAQLRFAGAAASGRRASYASAVPWRIIVCLLLPFAAGFHLSYLLRTINALIAGQLATEIDIGPAELGLLTSAYFLAFGAAQIPCGILLDRHGPKLVQCVLLLIASAGALVFAVANNLVLLTIGRALIGLGVAAGLMAGLKAIVQWIPAGRQALANGWMMMLGTLGAVTATAPADLMITSIGWRGLFAVMGGLSALVALLVLLLVPEQRPSRAPPLPGPTITVWSIYADARFWRIAPLSALGIGTSWALQGLWAAPWLRDVDALDRAAVVSHLGIMAAVLSICGLVLGLAADRLRHSGIPTAILLAGTFALSLVGQVALVLDWPVPSIVSWSLIAIAGVATVLGYTVLGEIFPQHASGRANGALNLLQVAAAFAVQSVFGMIVSLWEANAGSYPPEAYRTALAVFVGLQLVGFGWFAVATTNPSRRANRWASCAPRDRSETAYGKATLHWVTQMQHAHRDAAAWRSAAVGALVALGTIGLATSAPSRNLHSVDARSWALARPAEMLDPHAVSILVRTLPLHGGGAYGQPR